MLNSLVAKLAHAYGKACAPFFLGFAEFIHSRMNEEGAERLFFFTREGNFFEAVYRTRYSDEAQKICVLPVSRLATFGPSLKDVGVDSLMRLWSQYSTQSVSAFILSLGLNPADFSEIVDKHYLNLVDAIVYPWQNPQFLALLDDKVFQERVTERLASQRDLLKRLLLQNGWRDGMTVGVVDIGWRGTIQDNLAHIMPSSKIVGCYLGLYKFLNPQPVNTKKYGYVFDANQGREINRFVEELSLVEMLTNSPFGSVKGYRENGGEISTENLIDELENLVFERYTKYFQAGVLDALTNQKNTMTGSACVDSFASPSPLALIAHSRLQHNEIFGLGSFINQGAFVPLKVAKGIFRKKHRTHFRKFVHSFVAPLIF